MRYSHDETLARVRQALKVIRRAGVLVREQFGCSVVCAEAWLCPEVKRRTAPGAVYYTMHDAKHYERYGELRLRVITPGPFETTPTLMLGIREVLTEAGLESIPDGNQEIVIRDERSEI